MLIYSLIYSLIISFICYLYTYSYINATIYLSIETFYGIDYFFISSFLHFFIFSILHITHKREYNNNQTNSKQQSNQIFAEISINLEVLRKNHDEKNQKDDDEG